VVREALSGGLAKVVAAAAAAAWVSAASAIAAQPAEPTKAQELIAAALLRHDRMPDAARVQTLAPDLQRAAAEYRRRESAFKSALAPPPGAGDDERAAYDRRVDIERTLFSLFSRRDSPRLAASLALDFPLDGLQQEAAFIDDLLKDLPVKWVAPYLNLVAANDKLCAGRPEEARRHLVAARDAAQQPLIRAAAAYLLETHRCVASAR
jgi:hypothetical protein